MSPDERTEALPALYARLAPDLFRLAVAVTADRALAEDLVHDAFVRFDRLAARPTAGAEAAYLRRTVVNLARDHHRHLAVVRRREPSAPGDAPSAESVAGDAQRDRAVAAAVAALPDRQRECVALHYFADLSDVAVATELGIAVGSVKTHLHRARATLARHLEDLR